MKVVDGRVVRSPVDLLLGGLNVVSLPLVRGEDGEEMSETAQFYGFEDWGDHFRNVGPRISQFTAWRPTASEPGCIIEIRFRCFVVPGAFSRAANRWARTARLAHAGRNQWRGNGLALAIRVAPPGSGARDASTPGSRRQWPHDSR